MAVESKPLFHPEVIRQHVRAFKLPGHVAALQPKLDHWADLIASGQADDLKETALLPDFLTDLFCGVLGCSTTILCTVRIIEHEPEAPGSNGADRSDGRK